MSKYMLVGMLMNMLISLMAQQPVSIKHDSIIYTIHKNHLRSIVFMDRIIGVEQFKENDFLQSVQIEDQGNLYIRVFMEHSLTHYLQSLAPEWEADLLTEKGNFQFAFLVDGKNIYTENLHLGAFGKENKNLRTVFRVPLYSIQKEDSWGRFLWQRFWMSGGQDVLYEGDHELKIQIRPYLQKEVLIVGELIAEGSIRVVSNPNTIKPGDFKLQHPASADEWTLSSAGMDVSLIEQMNKRINSAVFKDITSVVVIREGKLWLEEYFNGSDKATLHDTRSVGKSFVSALMGMAIKDGYLSHEEETLDHFYDLEKYQNYHPAKNNITLKSLLTMTSPFDGTDLDDESPGHENKMYQSTDWVRFVLGLPLDNDKSKASRWDYFTGGAVVLGDILHQTIPGGLEIYAGQNLLNPLGFTDFQWEYTPQKVVNTAGGLRLRSIDLAKFGQLYLNKGSWNGKQLLSPEWCTKSLARQVEISKNEGYGYLFWNKVMESGNHQYNVSYASGNGGNKIYIFNDLSLVVVITSKAYDQVYGHVQSDRLLAEYILKALQ